MNLNKNNKPSSTIHYCYNRVAANILMGEECDNQASQGLYPVLEYVIDGKSVKERIDEGSIQLEEVISYLEENNVTVLDEVFSSFCQKLDDENKSPEVHLVSATSGDVNIGKLRNNTM